MRRDNSVDLHGATPITMDGRDRRTKIDAPRKRYIVKTSKASVALTPYVGVQSRIAEALRNESAIMPLQVTIPMRSLDGITASL